jgi:nucleotide-binding universal stress UspA family protein
MGSKIIPFNKEMTKMKTLVCIDGSKFADKAVKYGSQFANNYGEDLTILHVIEEVVPNKDLHPYPGFESKKQKAETILSRAKELAEEDSNGLKCHKKIACGPVSSEISRIAEVEGFENIILGTSGAGGLKRMFLGSVSYDVMRHAHCNVGIVR